MTASVLEKPAVYTPEEFEALPDAEAYELDAEGHLVERNMGHESALVTSYLLHLLIGAVPRTVGWVSGPDTGLRIFPGRGHRIPRPDVTFIRRARQPRPAKGFVEVIPDLVVEVVSPNDTADELESKVREYVGVGIALVWVVYPTTQTVHVYRADGTSHVLQADDQLTGEGIVPNFAVRVGDIFPPDEDVAE